MSCRVLAPRLGFLITWIHWTLGRAGSPVLLPPITNYCSEIVGGVGITQTLSIRLGVIIAVAYINLQEIRTSVLVEIGMII